ncbi:hypothetical protein AYI68_g1874 [Smittium mucronatum]|uniref:Uncharacterized protein n=1 Tax=Smittium mucronatum TaxID=133383 RepID=A0A1R0H4D7_9FUNG|nr:hypothetical protein AYI68_g1874 [Smittium mucronatum]
MKALSLDALISKKPSQRRKRVQPFFRFQQIFNYEAFDVSIGSEELRRRRGPYRPFAEVSSVSIQKQECNQGKPSEITRILNPAFHDPEKDRVKDEKISTSQSPFNRPSWDGNQYQRNRSQGALYQD